MVLYRAGQIPYGLLNFSNVFSYKSAYDVRAGLLSIPQIFEIFGNIPVILGERMVKFVLDCFYSFLPLCIYNAIMIRLLTFYAISEILAT
jgi:hypothetical protein